MKRAARYSPPRSSAPKYVPAERQQHLQKLATNRQRTRYRLYGRAWSKYRAGFLARPENALCVECKARGRIVAAEEVDHTIPHRGDHKLFWDTANHQGLCKTCHSRKTASQDGGFGNAPRPAKSSG